MGSLICTLSGCIPMKETYFRPLAKGGKVSGDACQGRTGVPRAIDFQYDDVKISILSDYEANYIAVVFAFLKKRALAKKILVPAKKILVQTNNKDREKLHLIRFLKRNSTLPIHDRLFLEGFKGDWYELYFQSERELAKEFTLLIPPLEINGKEIVIPPVVWTLKSGWFIHYLNC